MKVNVLPVLFDRGPLATVCLDSLDPVLCGLGDGGALAGRDVSALPYVNANRRVIGVGVFLSLECLNVPRAGLVGVRDQPCLALSPAVVVHFRLRTDTMLSSRSRWNHVALCRKKSASAFATPRVAPVAAATPKAAPVVADNYDAGPFRFADPDPRLDLALSELAKLREQVAGIGGRQKQVYRVLRDATGRITGIEK
jgi:hypothetical protein